MEFEKKYTLGRSEKCTIVLADETVSRLHATLSILENGVILLTDCHSANGTKLWRNGTQVGINQEVIAPNDYVSFGDLRWKVQDLLEAIKMKDPSFKIVNRHIARPTFELTPRTPHLVKCPNCFVVKTPEFHCPNCT